MKEISTTARSLPLCAQPETSRKSSRAASAFTAQAKGAKRLSSRRSRVLAHAGTLSSTPGTSGWIGQKLPGKGAYIDIISTAADGPHLVNWKMTRFTGANGIHATMSQEDGEGGHKTQQVSARQMTPELMVNVFGADNPEIQHYIRSAQLAHEKGYGSTAADYSKGTKQRLAQKRGYGATSADYVRGLRNKNRKSAPEST